MTSQDGQPDSTTPDSNAPTRTKLARSWLIRIGVIAGAFAIFALWGLYDATVAYPARGLRAAQWFELEYLRQAENAGTLARSEIKDPVTELPAALDQVDQLGSLPERDRKVLLAKRDWLNALQLINSLNPEHTAFPRAGDSTARTRLASLDQALATRDQPKPLSAYDIPTQWVIFLGCIAIAVIMLARVFMVASRVYSWDPDSQRLTLPGGSSIVPDDIEEFDKRKWDKFLIFIKIKPSHDTLASQELRLDLLQHTPLEEWILAMELTAFGSQEDDEEPAENSEDSTDDQASKNDPTSDTTPQTTNSESS